MGQDESKSAGEEATVRGNELGARVLVGGERGELFLASRSVRCTCGGLRMLFGESVCSFGALLEASRGVIPPLSWSQRCGGE